MGLSGPASVVMAQPPWVGHARFAVGERSPARDRTQWGTRTERSERESMASGCAGFSPPGGEWGRGTPLLRAVPVATVQIVMSACVSVLCVCCVCERESNARVLQFG